MTTQSVHGGKAPRFGVLPLMKGDRGQARYAIFDTRTQRITNGVYLRLDLAMENAAYAEASGSDVDDMTPCAEALGLLFPPGRTRSVHHV